MTKVRGARQPQIIAFGGCGVADEWADPRVFRYVLAATGASSPEVALITAASGNDHALTMKLHRMFRRLGASTQHLPVERTAGIADGVPQVQDFDLIHVEGGNTTYLMHQLRDSGFDRVLSEAWGRGVVLSGTSAGASCWFSRAISASPFSCFEAQVAVAPVRGLGLIDRSLCVHYDRSPIRRREYHEQVAGGLEAGFGLDHDAGLHFVGTELAAVITRRPGASASVVKWRDGEVMVRRLEAQSVGERTWGEWLGQAVNPMVRMLRRHMPHRVQAMARRSDGE